MSYKESSNQSGFTFIELIVVILILSTLAVTALARFADLEEEADIATNKGMAGLLSTAIQNASIQWLVSGSPGRIQNLANFATGELDMSTNGWPIGVDKGNANDNIGLGNVGCTSLWNYLLETGPTSATNGNSDYQSYRHSSSKQCSFVLRNNGDTANRTNAQLGILYDSNDGNITTCGQLTSISC